MRDRVPLLPLFLAVQAAVLLWNLPLLDPWSDELFTYSTSASEPERLLRVLRHDMHPPLYFVLGHYWLKLPLPLDAVDKLRALSALFALAGTMLLDRLWLRGMRWETRAFALAVWTLSPCALLYSRMVRGYSLQAALAIPAFYFAWRWLEAPGRKRFWAAAAWMSLLSYTHYLPGAALLGATGVLLAAKRRWTSIAALAGVFAIAYLPWMKALWGALSAWSAGSIYSASYLLTGRVATEHLLKVGYGATSFVLGESFPAVAFVGFAPAAVLLAAGARRVWTERRTLAWLLALSGAIAYFGAARWVSYPFVPGRLIFLLPFAALGLAAGFEARRRWAAALMTLVCVVGVASYHRREGFLNPGFAMPYRDVAAVIESRPLEAAVVYADGYNIDAGALVHRLGYRVGVSAVDAGNAGAFEAQAGGRRRVWFLRNTHDVSPGGVVGRTAERMCAGRVKRTWEFGAYPAWQRTAMGWVGVGEPLTHYSRLIECVEP